MATANDLYEILSLALLKKGQDPNIQPGDLDDLEALAHDPEALAKRLGVELNGVPMDEEEGDDDTDDGDESDAPPEMSKSRHAHTETLGQRLARLRLSRFA